MYPTELLTEERVPPADLNLGDVVRLPGPDPFSDSVVTQIADGRVYLFRAYVTTADFTYTGGVIPYIGVETWNVDLSHAMTFIRVRRARPLK